MPRALPDLDADTVAAVRKQSERSGITEMTGVQVKEIARANGRLHVGYQHEGTAQTIDADRMVNGAGRVAKVDTLYLKAGDVRPDGIHIEFDPYLRLISNSSVWVCGNALV